MIVDCFTDKVDGTHFAAIMSATVAVISLAPTIVIDMGCSIGGMNEVLKACVTSGGLIALLYVGVLNSGIGYVTQIIGQRGVNPTVASLILSLESVFGVLAGWLFLHQNLSLRELAGCALVFIAIIIAQLNDFKKQK